MIQNKGKQLLADLKLYSDYLKFRAEKNRFETWEEACEDVLETHRAKYGDKINYLLEEILPSYKNKEFLASQRSLQYRRDSIFRNNARLYNCSVMYTYAPDCFNKGFFLLLSGCGLGINLKQNNITQLRKPIHDDGPVNAGEQRLLDFLCVKLPGIMLPKCCQK